MKRRQLVSLLGGAALPSFSALPAYAGPADGCDAPLSRDDGWRVAAIDDDKLVYHAALCTMADRLASSSEANIHAVLVVRSGTLVFERYFTGPDEVPAIFSGRRVENVTFDADTGFTREVGVEERRIACRRHRDRSGADPQRRRTDPGLFSRACGHAHAAKGSPPAAARARHDDGARMDRGHAGDRRPANDEQRMYLSGDPCRYVLSRPAIAPPGQEFFYSTGALALVSAIVHKTTGQPLDEFARANLLAPLGISGEQWSRLGRDTDAGGGMRLRPRDMAKIGQLVLAGGRWNDRQIVSKAGSMPRRRR